MTSLPPAADVWTRLNERRVSETSLREGGDSKPSDVLDRWAAQQQRRFLQSWTHVQSIRSPAMLLQEYSVILTSPDKVVVRKGVDALRMDLTAMIRAASSPEGRVCFRDVGETLERLLVALMGHPSPRPRRRSIQMLNALYTGLDWELAAPFVPTVTTAGTPFVVDTVVRVSLRSPDFLVLVSAPSFDTAVSDGSSSVLTAHTPKVSVVGAAGGGDPDAVMYRVTLNLKTFPCAGFYDWRVVTVSPSGEVAVAVAVDAGLRPVSSRWSSRRRPIGRGAGAGAGAGAGSGGVSSSTATNPGVPVMCQGRFIVHRASLQSEQFQEVVIDLQNMEVDPASGEVSRHGTFSDVAGSLAPLKDAGITSVMLVGALERDNGWGDGQAAIEAEEQVEAASSRRTDSDGDDSDGSGVYSDGESAFGMLPLHVDAMSGGRRQRSLATAPWEAYLAQHAGSRAFASRPDANPHAIVSRTCPNRMLGGVAGLRELVDTAKGLGINVVMQVDPCVSASRPHRQYSGLFAHMIDSRGAKVVHPGTDGRYNQFEDQALLNYRKLDTWQLLVSEVTTLAQAMGAGSVYLCDAQALPLILATDTDEMFRMDPDGESAYTPQQMLEGEVVCANTEVGFWSTRLSRSYPNPLLIKLVRSLWAVSPEFEVLGECHWGREAALANSGVLPQCPEFVDALASTIGRGVDKLGFMTTPSNPDAKTPVARLQAFFQQSSRRLPPGAEALQIRSLSSARQPYPALLLGRTAWPGVDLLYCLPGIPMLFQEETCGRAYRVDVTHTYVANQVLPPAHTHGGHKLLNQRSKRSPGALRRRRRLHMVRREEGEDGVGGRGGDFGMGGRSVSDPNLARLLGMAGAHLGSGGGGGGGGGGGVSGGGGADGGKAGGGGGLPPSGKAAFPATLKGVEAVPDYEGHVGVGGVVAATALKSNRDSSAELAAMGILPMTTGASKSMTATLSSPALYELMSGPTALGGSPIKTRRPQPPPPIRGPSATHASGGASSDDSVGLDLMGGGGGADDDHHPTFDDDAGGAAWHHLSSDDEADTPFGLDVGWYSATSTPAASLNPGAAAAAAASSSSSAGRSGSDPAALVVRGRKVRAGSAAAHTLHEDVVAPSGHHVRSWQPVQGLRLHGDSGADNLKSMQLLEQRLLAEVGPQFGFDLRMIHKHYQHRQELRRRFKVLQAGTMVLLRANHRFGEHGHVFAFGRVHQNEVAVVACNFNHHPSTFSVDCSPLADAFGASLRPTQDAASPFVFAPGDKQRREPLPNFGAIWEARDIFQSELRHADELGPFQGFFTSDEAAHSAIPTTLEPHSSCCWLFRRKTSSAVVGDEDEDGGGADAAVDPSDVSVSVTGDDAVSALPPPSDTDMHWLLSSSISRLAASLQLKTGSDGLAGLLGLISSGASGGGSGAPGATGGKSSSGAGAGAPPRSWDSKSWTPPADVLRDSEIRHNVRHNLVFSLLHRAVAEVLTSKRRLRRADTEDSMLSGSSTSTRGTDSSPGKAERLATSLSGVLSVLVKHLSLAVAATGDDGEALTAAKLTRLPSAAGGGDDERDTHGWSGDVVADIVGCARASLFFAVQDLETESAEVVKALIIVARSHPEPSDPAFACANAVRVLAKRILVNNQLGPLVFLTPELGKWSTVGGLGVMVDELTVGLAALGAQVTVISPYYHVDRKGRGDYLAPDGIKYTGRTIPVWVGEERLELGLHEGVVKGVRVLFLHHSEVFPRPYPPHNAYSQLRALSCFNKASLETLCRLHLIPSIIVTNDWFTGLAAGFARHGQFGNVFNSTDFLHIAHNLDPSYEGRLFPERYQGALEHLHGLPAHVLVDPHWADVVINPTRAALLCSDTWATVSKSYRSDLLSGSPMRSLLSAAPEPFAHPNGIPVAARKARLAALPYANHDEAKAALQRKYFGMDPPDLSIPLFAFVGRVTLQKGVHLILNSVNELLWDLGNRAMFLVGGMASASDSYGSFCATAMRQLTAEHPGRFWADPTAFFTDGDAVNLGADFCMMPSMFEPGGIVQQEFFNAGTPVIAYKTGGLKDTVLEYDRKALTGNGFTFEAHTKHDFVMAVKRAVAVFHDPVHNTRIRDNAEASVIDLTRVSLGWFKEFNRLRRCLAVVDEGGDGGVETVLRFPVGVDKCVPGSTVVLTGDWIKWTAAGIPMTYQPPLPSSPLRDPKTGGGGGGGGGAAGGSVGGDSASLAREYPAGWFEATVYLPMGTHQFKFVVDGTWLTCSLYPTTQATAGPVNNCVYVAAKPISLSSL